MLKFKIQNSNVKFQIPKLKFWYSTLFIGIYFFIGALSLVINLNVCHAQPLSSTELINNAKQYDGKIIAYEGEVIGDVMARQENAWVNVNDGKNALGIWINRNLTKDIVYTGSYKSKGDLIEISGIFQRACPQHGGDLDIHAQSIRKISSGREIRERMNLEKRNLALLLAGILGLVWILKLLKIH